ncbi:hypothetical protein NIB75_06915 [Bacteroides uniformis]|nr:hypothetical protein [Bacteroides uniformis]
MTDKESFRYGVSTPPISSIVWKNEALEDTFFCLLACAASNNDGYLCR